MLIEWRPIGIRPTLRGLQIARAILEDAGFPMPDFRVGVCTMRTFTEGEGWDPTKPDPGTPKLLDEEAHNLPWGSPTNCLFGNIAKEYWLVFRETTIITSSGSWWEVEMEVKGEALRSFIDDHPELGFVVRYGVPRPGLRDRFRLELNPEAYQFPSLVAVAA